MGSFFRSWRRKIEVNKGFCENSDRVANHQRVGFFIALGNFLALTFWVWVRVYFSVIGDVKRDRTFVFDSLALLPIWVLSWFIGYVIISSSILTSKRITWHGVGAVAMLAVPAIPVAAWVFISFWRFLATP